MLPNDYKARKAIPLYTYLTQYSPNALVEVAKVAVAGNEQHNPGQPLHWAKGKSMDQLNTAMRHLFDHGMGNAYDEDDPWRDSQGQPIMHLAKAAWRLLAEIELLCEARELGIDINTLVRGTHESHDRIVELDDLGEHVGPADEPGPLMSPGPLLPMEMQDDYAKMAPAPPWPGSSPTPKGRLLVCGCYGQCGVFHGVAPMSPHVPPYPLAEDYTVTKTAVVPSGPKDPSGKPYAQYVPVTAGGNERPI